MIQSFNMHLILKYIRQNMLEMTAASALMRLMSEKGTESQTDRYLRIKEQRLDWTVFTSR